MSLSLILSSAYVGPELAVEYGQLPPAFLPVGNCRLYEYQIPLLRAFGPIHLTLPDQFRLSTHDRRRLQALGIDILWLPENLRLGEAVVYSCNYLGIGDGEVRILHGDTLFDEPLPLGSDIFSVADEGEAYSWALVDVHEGRVLGVRSVPAVAQVEVVKPVAVGYFALSSSSTLVRAITHEQGDFVRGLNYYAEEIPVMAHPTKRWLDFGHVHTFYRSRRVVTTARSFNSLVNDGVAIRKTSNDNAKIQAEASWLASVPASLRGFTARLFDFGQADGQTYYETEYQYNPTLSELFVFGVLNRPTWNAILDSCEDFLQKSATIKGGLSVGDVLDALGANKTMTRLEAYARASGFDIYHANRLSGRSMPSLMHVAEEMTALIAVPGNLPGSVMHGDFCFSNILFDFRIQRIRVIDPRGHVLTGQPTIFGDFRYDMAKLAHSVQGRYDQIIAGRYLLSGGEYDYDLSFEPVVQQQWLVERLHSLCIEGVRMTDELVLALTVVLFLSMLPLHADRPDRQRAFVANALRLYSTFD